MDWVISFQISVPMTGAIIRREDQDDAAGNLEDRVSPRSGRRATPIPREHLDRRAQKKAYCRSDGQVNAKKIGVFAASDP